MELVRDMGRWEDFLLSQGYELHGQLDSGGFSDVFAVNSVSTGRAMAVKRIVARRSIMADPRLKTEISCLTKLRVPGSCVIWLEEVMVRDSVACLVLELAPLGDLERYTSRHWPLSPELVKCCVRQVSTALTHCHRLHIAHRDLHPANVLLLSPRRVRLGDFGLAVTCSPSRPRPRPPLCRDYEGRQTYVAPEVLAQRPYDALRADLWSLGALCAFLATGHHPQPALPCPECGHLPGHPLLSSVSDCEKDQCVVRTWRHSDPTVPCRRCEHIPGHPPVSTVSENDQCSCSLSGERNEGSHSQRETDVHKTNPCRSVKEFLPVPPRSKRYRASSCDSEGSCQSKSDTEGTFQSESDTEERLSSPHHSIPDSGPECGSSSQSHSEENFCHCECHQGDPVFMTTMAAKRETAREMTEVKGALMELVSNLCVHEPSDRMSAEDALDWWKQRMAKTGKS